MRGKLISPNISVENLHEPKQKLFENCQKWQNSHIYLGKIFFLVIPWEKKNALIISSFPYHNYICILKNNYVELYLLKNFYISSVSLVPSTYIVLNK